MTDPLLACFCRCSFSGSPLRHALQQRKPTPVHHPASPGSKCAVADGGRSSQDTTRYRPLAASTRSLARSPVPADLLLLAVSEGLESAGRLALRCCPHISQSLDAYISTDPKAIHHPREKGPSLSPTFCRSHSRFCCSSLGTHLLLTSLALPGIRITTPLQSAAGPNTSQFPVISSHRSSRQVLRLALLLLILPSPARVAKLKTVQKSTVGSAPKYRQAQLPTN